MTKKMNEEGFDAIASLNSSIDERLAKLPLRIPIVLHNIEIGNMKIDFKYNKGRKLPINEEEKFDFLHTFLVILKELDDIARLVKKDIELIAKMVTGKYEEKKSRLVDLILFLNHPGLVYYDWPWELFHIKEEEMFKLVKSEGPITLRNSLLQDRINIWLSKKDTAGVKINKLKDSLLEYAFATSPKEIPFKIGRPRISLLEKMKPERIVNAYHDISALLRIAKRNEKRYTGNIREFIRNAEKEFLFSKKNDPKWRSTYKQSIEDKEFEFFYLIWSCLENDSRLHKAFESFSLQPGNLAKKVLAGLLEVSESTIEKYISKNLSSS